MHEPTLWTNLAREREEESWAFERGKGASHQHFPAHGGLRSKINQGEISYGVLELLGTSTTTYTSFSMRREGKSFVSLSSFVDFQPCFLVGKTCEG